MRMLPSTLRGSNRAKPTGWPRQRACAAMEPFGRCSSVRVPVSAAPAEIARAPGELAGCDWRAA